MDRWEDQWGPENLRMSPVDGAEELAMPITPERAEERRRGDGEDKRAGRRRGGQRKRLHTDEEIAIRGRDYRREKEEGNGSGDVVPCAF